MKDLKQFDILFVGLKEGKHLFEYQIDKTFFEYFNFDEFLDTSIDIELSFVKKSTLFELTFTSTGSVTIPCDISSEIFDQPIDSELNLVVKFGPEYNNENEELLILPHEAFQLNVGQFIYEMVILAVPTKRVHPKVVDGTMESEALKKLEELSIKESKSVEETDPRWNKLKNLITVKKT